MIKKMEIIFLPEGEQLGQIPLWIIHLFKTSYLNHIFWRKITVFKKKLKSSVRKGLVWFFILYYEKY